MIADGETVRLITNALQKFDEISVKWQIHQNEIVALCRETTQSVQA